MRSFYLLSKFFLPEATVKHPQSDNLASTTTVLDNNMKEESIVARKHIIDRMRSKKLMPYSIEIDKDLYSSVKRASVRCRKHL